MSGYHPAAYSQREHNEFMSEQGCAEERAYRSAGLRYPALINRPARFAQHGLL